MPCAFFSKHHRNRAAAPLCILAAAANAFAGHPIEPSMTDGRTDVARTLLPDDPPGLLTIGGRAGQHQSGAVVDSITGLWTTPKRDAFLFLDSLYDFRDDGQVLSANGLAYRRQLPGREVIVGANVFWDAISSERGNDFNQLGLGAEVLTRWVDFRFNYYLPEDERFEASRRTERENDTRLEERDEITLLPITRVEIRQIRGGGIRLVEVPTGRFVRKISRESEIRSQTRTRTFKRYEAALEGFDTELGFLIPGLDRYTEVRVFGGYFHYDNPFGSPFEGFRARLEARLLPGVIADVEYFEDDRLNDGHWFAGVRASVPLSIFNIFTLRNPFEGAGSYFTPRRREFSERMAEMIVRPSRRQTATSGEISSRERTSIRSFRVER